MQRASKFMCGVQVMNTAELRKAAKCIFLAVEENIAQDIADKLNKAAHEIDRLRNELNVAERRIEELTRPFSF